MPDASIQASFPMRLIRLAENNFMMMKPYLSILFSLSFLLSLSNGVLAAKIMSEAETDDLPYVKIKVHKDFSVLAEQPQSLNKIIMLEVSASYCAYCRVLEEEIVKPMLRSGDYKNTVIISKFEIDSSDTMKDFAGNDTTAAALAKKYEVKLTPTLLFLDVNGNEVAERIMGIYSLDYFGAFVDKALLNGLRVIKNGSI